MLLSQIGLSSLCSSIQNTFSGIVINVINSPTLDISFSLKGGNFMSTQYGDLATHPVPTDQYRYCFQVSIPFAVLWFYDIFAIEMVTHRFINPLPHGKQIIILLHVKYYLYLLIILSFPGFEHSSMKSSFSLSSLRSAPAPPGGRYEQLERPYHSLTKKR